MKRKTLNALFFVVLCIVVTPAVAMHLKDDELVNKEFDREQVALEQSSYDPVKIALKTLFSDNDDKVSCDLEEMQNPPKSPGTGPYRWGCTWDMEEMLREAGPQCSAAQLLVCLANRAGVEAPDSFVPVNENDTDLDLQRRNKSLSLLQCLLIEMI